MKCSYIASVCTSSQLGYIKKHVLGFQLLSALEKQGRNDLTADNLSFMCSESFSNIQSDTSQYLQVVKV